MQLSSNIADVSLQIVFRQTDDRWVHDVFVEHNGQQKKFLTSIEGDPQQNWPASPPLQDASQQELENGSAVLAVGMAGDSHWSASFSIEESGTVFADLACLSKKGGHSEDACLGSRYRIAPGVLTSAFEQQGLELGSAINIDPANFSAVKFESDDHHGGKVENENDRVTSENESEVPNEVSIDVPIETPNRPTETLNDPKSEERYCLNLDGLELQIFPVCGDGSATMVSLYDDELTIFPVKATSESGKAARWGYRISAVPPIIQRTL